MKKTRVLLLTALFCLLSLPVLAQGLKFSPPGGRFTIDFPGTEEPTESTETKTGTGAAFPLTTSVFLQRDGQLLTLAGWVDYNPKWNFDPRGEMNANRDNFLKGSLEGKVTSEKDIKIGGYQGIEFFADIKGDRTVRGRVYIVGKRPYLLIGIAPKGTETVRIEKFMSSFKLTR